MFLIVRSILFFLIATHVLAQIVEQDTETQSLIKPNLQENTQKQNCTCKNNGECYSTSSSDSFTLDQTKDSYCRCPNYYIGKQCQIEAYEVLTIKEISQKINIHDYKYFYYEPMEQNMYSFSFEFCLDYKTTFKPLEDKFVDDTVTFFMTIQNQDGGFVIDEQITKAITITVQNNQCKKVTVDYTVLLITKTKAIQKLILALKLGQKLSIDSSKQEKEIQKIIQKDNTKDKQQIKQIKNQVKKEEVNTDKKLQNSSQKSDKIVDTQKQIVPIKGQKILIDFHPISYTIESTKKKSTIVKEQEIGKKQNLKSINDFKSKSPSKLKQNDDTYYSRTIYINFSVYPFMVEFVVFNILFSLTTLAAFMIVGIMIFVIRSRILGIRITRSLGISSRLINDLRHFDRYIPAEKYIQKEKKEGDTSPNSSYIECSICLVKFENMDFVRRTPCFHSFHKSCLDTWCHQNLNCPMCRKSLTEKNMAQFFNSTALQLKNSPESDQ